MRLFRQLGRFAVLLLVVAIVVTDTWLDYTSQPWSTKWIIIVGCAVLLIWLVVEARYWQVKRKRNARIASLDDVVEETLRHQRND